ncbi:N-acetyltransferase domain-containing protein [Mycena venus]|uniref:N-acetyltransferase domain-containing protein n=1 Tax=Mycena venus TaxID=2733690 RepID=A0A8H6YEV4_9AGAR|nr:N-acetyltransferase domain-containing protein [Mycena venus]
MAEIVVRRLVNPTEDEIEQAATVLKNAFHAAGDPFGHSLSGGNLELDALLLRTQVRAAVVGGELWTAGFGPTDICAVATCEEQRAAGWYEVEAKFPPELKKWWSEYFIPRYNAWNASVIGEGTKLKSWQLQLLGTSPEHQRKGLSGALIKAVESKAVADGVIMCLETTNDPNVAFYRKLGFVVRGTVSLVGSGGETTMTAPDQALNLGQGLVLGIFAI